MQSIYSMLAHPASRLQSGHHRPRLHTAWQPAQLAVKGGTPLLCRGGALRFWADGASSDVALVKSCHVAGADWGSWHDHVWFSTQYVSYCSSLLRRFPMVNLGQSVGIVRHHSSQVLLQIHCRQAVQQLQQIRCAPLAGGGYLQSHRLSKPHHGAWRRRSP